MLQHRRITILIQKVRVSSNDASQMHLNVGLFERGSDSKHPKPVPSNCPDGPLLDQIQVSGSFAYERISLGNPGDAGWTKVFV